nr:hypothetical protein [uncultured Sphaerochaeta sp.]
MQQLPLSVAFLQEQYLPCLPVKHHGGIPVPLVQGEFVDAQMGAVMGGQHLPVLALQHGLVDLPDQLAIGMECGGKPLDCHVRMAEESFHHALEASGGEVPGLLEGNRLAAGPVASRAQVLLVAHLQDDLPVSQAQVVQQDVQMLVDVHLCLAMRAARGQGTCHSPVDGFNDDKTGLGLFSLDSCRACHQEIW